MGDVDRRFLLLLSFLTFQFQGHADSSFPLFVLRPEEKEKTVGSNATFYCMSSAKSVRMHWKINDRNPNQYNGVQFTTNWWYIILKIDNVTVHMDGDYCCFFYYNQIVMKSCGGLRVKRGPFIKFGPKNQTSDISSNISLTCDVEAFPAPKVFWFRNGHDVCNTEEKSHCSLISKSKEYHQATLKISNASLNDAGDYQCLANTTFGEVRSEKAWISVKAKLGTSTVSSTLTLPSESRPTNLRTTDGIEHEVSATLDFTNIDAATTCETMMYTERQYATSLSTTTQKSYHGDEPPNPNGKILLYFIGGIILVVVLVVAGISYRKRKLRADRLKKSSMRMKTMHKSLGSDENYPNLEKLKYPFDKLEIIEKLGEGVFGLVYKARAPDLMQLREVTTVAVKMLRPLDRKIQTKVENFAQEANYISTFKHPNLIQLLGVCAEDGCHYHSPGTISCLLFEYMDGGDLRTFLRRNGPYKLLDPRSKALDIPLTDITKLSICCQIACGMQYLTEKNFIHRDLATRNCLISSKDFTIKIADFGLSRCTDDSDYYTANGSEIVPIRWMSPEAIEYERYSWQSDVWAYGVTLWEIYTYALQPYYSLSNDEVVRQVCEGMRLPKPPCAPDWMYNLMKLCWQTKPEERPNFPTIYSVLRAILLNGGQLPRSPPQNYVEYSIAETQLHSNGNNSNEMRLPGLYATDLAATYLPAPPQFSSLDSIHGLSTPPDPASQHNLTRADGRLVSSYGKCDGYSCSIPRSASTPIEAVTPNFSTDSCLPDSPASMPCSIRNSSS